MGEKTASSRAPWEGWKPWLAFYGQPKPGFIASLSSFVRYYSRMTDYLFSAPSSTEALTPLWDIIKNGDKLDTAFVCRGRCGWWLT